MKANRVLLSMLLGLGVLAAGALTVWRVGLQNRSRYTDADRIRVPAAAAPVRRVLWQPAEPLIAGPGVPPDQYEPRISADGSTMVFVRGRAGANADLFTCKRTPDGWTAPEPIAAINTEHDELGPEFSPDGQALYFYSDRPGSMGGFDIWISRATPAGWGDPVNLGPSVNSAFNEYGPALSPDGRRLYFSSNRPRPGEPDVQRDAWPATIREQRARHDYDLFYCDLETTGPGPAAPISELNTLADEGAPAISPAGDFLYFASNRPGGFGGFDIYRSRILRGRITPPENLGPAVNSAVNDLDPGLSMDGFRLFFSTDRPLPGPAVGNRSTDQASPPAADPKSPEPSRYALWVSGSREVFIEVDPARADFFTQLWAVAWPWLLLLTFIGLLALVLRSLISDAAMRRRLARLSLMAKCLLVSLIIHACILSLLAVWRVGNAIGSILHSSGGTRVSLGSIGTGGLAAQVRAPVATIQFQSPQVIAPRAPVAPPLISAPQLTLAASPAPVDLSTPPTQLSLGESRPQGATPNLTASPPSLSIGAVQPRTPAATPADAPSTESRPDLLAGISSPQPTRARAVGPAVSATTIQLLPASAAVPDPSRQAAAIPKLTDAPPNTETTTASAGATLLAAPEPRSFDAPRLPGLPAPSTSGTEATTESTSAVALPSPARADQRISGSIQAPTIILSPGAAAIPDATLPSSRVILSDPTSTVGSPAPVQSTTALPGLGKVSAAAPRLPGQPARQIPVEGRSGEPTTAALPDRIALVDGPRAPSIGSPSAAPTIQLDPRASDIQTSSASNGAGAPATLTDSTGPSTSPSPSSIGAGLPTLPGLAVRLPTTPEPPAQPIESFAQRAPEVRAQVLEQTGGSQETEHAVALALEWFKSHQDPDGHWSGRHFDDRCGKCAGEAEIDSDASMTGMALLCFLSAGHTHNSEGPHRDSVRRALTWLVDRQDDSGDLRRGETMHSQTIAAVALCEAFAMTRDPWLEGPARRAAMFVARGVANRKSDKDVAVLGWQIMAIKSADRCGFSVPHAAFEAAGRWLDRVASPGAPGRYADRPGDGPSAAATAEALFVQQLLGRTREEPRMQESAQFILATPPAWRRGAPTYYWYYATLALFQQQGEPWRRWNAAVAKELIANQRQDGPAAGSWDPQDSWSRLGGRIYQTAVCTLSLEVYYRYAPADAAPR